MARIKAPAAPVIIAMHPHSGPAKAYPLRNLGLTVSKLLPWTVGHTGTSS